MTNPVNIITRLDELVDVQVSATEPTARVNGDALEDNDLWLDLSAAPPAWKIYDSSGPSYVTMGGGAGGSGVRVEKAGTVVGTRGGINFIAGTGVSLTVSDDATDDEVDVTIAASPGGGSDTFATALLHIQDEKTSGTAGGGFTSGAWQTRDLNTVKTNEITGASLTSNQVTLPAGTYWVEADAPAFRVRRHQLRLRDVTNSATLALGGNALTDNAATTQTMTRALLAGRFTLASSATVELQHQAELTQASNGLGTPGNFGTEIYSVLRIWGVA